MLSNRQLEIAAQFAESWPVRRERTDRNDCDPEQLENSGDLECVCTWFLPHEGGWPALEAFFAVCGEQKAKRYRDIMNREGYVNLDILSEEDFLQARETYDQLEVISKDYVFKIEMQSGADKVAQDFRAAKR